MDELRVSNELLGDSEAIADRIEREGYVFFRDVVDRDVVRHVRRSVMAWFEARDLIEVVDDQPMWTGVDLAGLGPNPDALLDTGLWEWFAFHPDFRRLSELVFGEPVRVLPAGEYQFTWPGKPDCWSIIHQDGPYNTALEFVVGWVPLMDIDESLGGLAVVPTPQSVGALQHPTRDDPRGSALPFLQPGQFDAGAWRRADYRPGDILFFGQSTPHCGMPNTSDRVRLSIDIRVQPMSSTAPITGVVTASDGRRIVIAADDATERELTVDDRTTMPFIDPHSLLGRRVMATADAGRALLIRNQRGHVPAHQ